VLLASRTDLFSAPPSFFPESSFSLSYGVILPSSFMLILLCLCAFRTFPPVSVSCTVLSLSVLSWAFLLPLLFLLFLLPTVSWFFFFFFPYPTLLNFRSFPSFFPPFSFLLGSASPFSHSCFFSGTFGFSANLLLTSFFATHSSILTSDSFHLTDFSFSFFSTERSTTFGFFFPNNGFGSPFSLLYFRRSVSPLVRCYSFLTGWLLPSLPPSSP